MLEGFEQTHGCIVLTCHAVLFVFRKVCCDIFDLIFAKQLNEGKKTQTCTERGTQAISIDQNITDLVVSSFDLGQ